MIKSGYSKNNANYNYSKLNFKNKNRSKSCIHGVSKTSHIAMLLENTLKLTEYQV